MKVAGPSNLASGNSVITANTLPRTCENCYSSHMQFDVFYFGHPDKLIKYCQDHVVIKIESETICPTCSSRLRADWI